MAEPIQKTVQRMTRTNAPAISVFVRVSVASSANASKRSFALCTRRQTCSQKSQDGRCTRHLPDKNKSLGAEHHKCSGCRHFVQRGSHITMGLSSQPPSSIRRSTATAPRTLLNVTGCFYHRLHRQCRKSMWHHCGATHQRRGHRVHGRCWRHRHSRHQHDVLRHWCWHCVHG